MKNKKEVGLGVLITILLFVTSILIAVFIQKIKFHPMHLMMDGLAFLAVYLGVLYLE